MPKNFELSHRNKMSCRMNLNIKFPNLDFSGVKLLMNYRNYEKEKKCVIQDAE